MYFNKEFKKKPSRKIREDLSNPEHTSKRDEKTYTELDRKVKLFFKKNVAPNTEQHSKFIP